MSTRKICPLCDSADTSFVEEHEMYKLYGCASCKAQFWTPFKNPGASWYEHDERYSNRNFDPLLTPSPAHRWVASVLDEADGTVFDVGCGTGNFLAHMRTKGWSGWGIDFDKDAIETGHRAFNLEHLEVADLQEFSTRHPGMQFSLVTFFDVIEHLDDHRDFLERISSLVRPGGSIALSTPYRHGWRWLLPADLPPRHLTRWDEESMRLLLERYGFTITKLHRLPASLYFITMKFKFKFGRWASLGIVQKAKERQAEATRSGKVSARIRLLSLVAKAKDILLFGVPAFFIWLTLLPTRKRYTDFMLIAQKQ